VAVRISFLLVAGLILGLVVIPWQATVAQDDQAGADFVEGLSRLNAEIKNNLAGQPSRRVAVVPFMGVDSDYPMVSAFIADQLVTALVSEGEYTIVDSYPLVKLIQEHDVSPLDLTTIEAFNLLKSRYENTSIIVGTITDLDTRVAVMSRVISADSGNFIGGSMVYLDVANEFAALVNKDRPGNQSRSASNDTDQPDSTTVADLTPMETATNKPVKDSGSSQESKPAETKQPVADKPVRVPDMKNESDVTIYNAARDYYQNNKFSSAITTFEKVVERFPDSPYADNAVYWIGESYYSMKNWEKARQQFQRVLDTYPYGNKVPDSTFKRGFAEEKMGQMEKAIFSMEEVIRRFGNAPIAQRAREKLQQLRAASQQ
jgi:tol-pal system protein YbgF